MGPPRSSTGPMPRLCWAAAATPPSSKATCGLATPLSRSSTRSCSQSLPSPPISESPFVLCADESWFADRSRERERESDERVPLTHEPLVVHFILLSPNNPNSVNSFFSPFQGPPTK